MEIRNIRSNLIKIQAGINESKSEEKIGFSPVDSVSIGQSMDSESNSVKINILHINDIHGAVEPMMDPNISYASPVGGLAYAKAVVDSEREKDPQGTLLLNAGDIAEGSMVAYLTKGKVVTDILKEMKFDAIALGNHDFAWGQGYLRNLVQGLEDTPFVAANITTVSDGQTINGVKPYIIKDVKGVKVAIIGLDTTDIERLVDKSKLEGLKFNDAAATLNKYIPEVKEKGADLVLVLSHLGFEEDKKLARQVQGINVIVGGHSHTELKEGYREGDTIIVQAGSQTRFLGELSLEFDIASKKIVNYSAKLIPIIDKDIKPDREVEEIVTHYLKEAQQVSSQPMGVALEDLHYSHKEAAKLNQILADALLKASKAEFALCSSRNLRGNIKKGKVTLKDLFNAFPMTEEDMVKLKVTGKMILTEIEERIADGGRGITVPAGFKYEYDTSRPSGNRVTSITTLDGKPLDLDKEYTIVTTISTARKKCFADARDVEICGSSQQVFFDYFKENSPWKDNPDDRVKDINQATN